MIFELYYKVSDTVCYKNFGGGLIMGGGKVFGTVDSVLGDQARGAEV